ncbi:MarR family winged helix-turn-helix transcriptional regulator [Pedobacter africanus]|uniref:DNA-binding transcriptional regulator, MarR family n=1 Tax=Pedobacter africanus TaxID=151894 RepID=A0A1W2CWW3_9SPHI|nr:MarR family transcriptional regulator [Pedobacter africanus]SMC89352.1 DNA-binding transcriptional regulator, MarR family [Pedobacter africanus]
MSSEAVSRIRKLSQHYAYTSIEMHEHIARKAGLSGTDQKYLGFFLTKGAMTAGELAEVTGLTTGAVTGLIDRFEKRKLVKRQFAKEDRRKVLVVPETDKIMKLLAPLYKSYRSRSEELIASFTEEELEIIEKYLQSSIGIMNETVNQIKNK